ncbi:3-hydroxyacyl-CoA dehydrogenase [Alteribacillus persepolensis]|uniref:L-gulonate 3-dehydrogenase n=2 Tax=Alteribacillus persepolensis TaxID=568899 RepID=A0A1G8F8K1_9BACI|nr:3-hydroxyacyl-CoA dehydrogenase [Alteribacillus persepolensis]
MGRGIAVTFVYQGYDVTILDIKERNKEQFNQLKTETIREIKRQLEILADGGVVPQHSIPAVMNRVKVSPISDPGENRWKQADILFEAVPELIEVKEKVLKQLTSQLSEKSLIASTTSSFSVNELSNFVVNKERFMNTHWLNPAYLIPLIEVSPGDETSEESITDMFQLLEKVGKMPVQCQPSPGFIVPRIQALAMNEASRLVEEGVASVEDIDKASRIGFGLRFAILGLLEFIDWGGADTLYHASNYLHDSLNDDRFIPPEIINHKMADGEIGMKTGKGFYSFEGKDIDEYQMETLRKFMDILKHLGFIGQPVKQK